MDGPRHRHIGANGSQLHMELYHACPRPFIRHMQHDIVIVEVRTDDIRHLLLKAVDEHLRLWRVTDDLLTIAGSREVHLPSAWHEWCHGVEPLLADQSGIERINDVRIVEAQVSGTSVGDGRLGGNLCIGSLTGVGSQDLHPLGSHVVVGIHRHSCRFVQLPVVELIHRVDRHHTVVNLLCNIHIIKVVVLAGNMHGQHSSQPQQGYPFEISHNHCLFIESLLRGKITKIIR